MSREESAARAPLAPGDLLDGKYQIIRVLGEGGMGIVYEAFHQKLEQTVAIKMMLPSMLERPSLVARFDREARAAAKIKSRHVARVFDVDVAPNGLPYIVMELLSGQDLAARLAENGPLPVSEAVGHLLEACVAIREALRARDRPSRPQAGQPVPRARR
ncbi:MAG: protein kinase [Polyangiaceae bacterium]